MMRKCSGFIYLYCSAWASRIHSQQKVNFSLILLQTSPKQSQIERCFFLSVECCLIQFGLDSYSISKIFMLKLILRLSKRYFKDLFYLNMKSQLCLVISFNTTKRYNVFEHNKCKFTCKCLAISKLHYSLPQYNKCLAFGAFIH